jgi:hypothetical protein
MSRYVGEGVVRGPLPVMAAWAFGGFLFWLGLDQWVKAGDEALADFGGDD